MERSEKIKLEKLLGEGSFGIVYQIVDTETDKKFALKRIDFCNQDSEREQAKKEADLLSNLHHDNILQYVESFEEDDSLFIVTEYCERGDLETYLEYKARQKEILQENKIAIWIYQIASGLHYLHERKILHRDLKTKNIFIMSDWSVRIGDLGIAKVLDLGQSKANSFVGTPAYMCPELFEQKPYNNRSDIWSLGCCAYEMMALKKAFEGKAIFKIIHNVISGTPPQIPKGYSSTLENLVYAMLQKDDFLRPTAFYLMNHQYIQQNLEKTNSFDNYDDHYDQELAERSKKKKIRSHHLSSNETSSSSGSGSSLTSWKNITNRIHEMEDEMRRTSEKQVLEIVNSLELNKYRNFRRKGMKQKSKKSGTLIDNNGTVEEEEDDGTFVYRGTVKDDEEDSGTFVHRGTIKNEDEDNEDDSGTFVYRGTVKNSDDSDSEEETINQTLVQKTNNEHEPNTENNEDIVAKTLLNRKDSHDEKGEIRGDDLTVLLKKNPKEAAKQIVQGLKKSMSLDEQKVEEKQTKKKKGGYLKKEARNRMQSDPGSNTNKILMMLEPLQFQTDTVTSPTQAVRLFPRGEYVSYSPKGKDSDKDFNYLNDDRSHVPFERKITTESLRSITAMLGDPANKTIVMEQIAQIQREIAMDIGEQQLSKCYDVMSQVDDDKVVQAVLRELLGPKKYEQYKEPLYYLRMFETSSAAKS